MKPDREVAPSIAVDRVGPERNPEAAVSALVNIHPATGSPVILRWPAVEKITGRSRSSVWRDIRKGKFPAAVQIGDNAVGWYAHEIHEWIASRPRAAYAA